MNPIQLTRELIKIPSPSGEEKQIADYLVKRLQKNFKTTKQKIGNRYNILATKGKPKLLLTTHMDTVPGQIKNYETKKWIGGRGVCDAKGIIASMISAAEQTNKDIALLFDVSEETDFAGIQKAKNLIRPKTVIIGEPTNLNIVYGQKGLIQLKIKTKGKPAPGATPEKGKSAITQLMNLLTQLMNIKYPNTKPLGKTTINIGTIKGGNAPNVVPENAEATIEIRTTTKNKKILNLIYEKIPRKNIELKYSYEPVLNKNINFLKNFKNKKITVPYFTEMYFWKAKKIVFGPGNYKYAHTNQEKITKKDIINGTKQYLKMIEEFA